MAVNALTNTAYIEVGLTPSPSNSGIQALNLNTNTFSPPFALQNVVSENISIDSGRGLILSPSENNTYTLLQLNNSGNITGEFVLGGIGGAGEYDSAANDCTTGIGLAADEFQSDVILVDLNQASFTAGAPGTWSAPTNVFPLAGDFSAGTSGILVAPGNSHLGVVTGEFGGESFAVLKLPSTPASGGTVPTIEDYTYVASLPVTPDGNAFAAGFDPHTITAYTSPNNGRAYAVIADWVLGYPLYLAIIDLENILNAPRVPGTHTIDPAFDLLATGTLRYIATQ